MAAVASPVAMTTMTVPMTVTMPAVIATTTVAAITAVTMHDVAARQQQGNGRSAQNFQHCKPLKIKKRAAV